MFAINETTGNVSLVGNLDRETQSFYALLVSVSVTVAKQVFNLFQDSGSSDTNHDSLL